MIDPDNLHPAAELEPLHKMLPAGGPLLTPSWDCPRCGRHIPGGMPPRRCLDDRTADACPLEFGL